MFTSVIIELLTTKMGECNEIMSNMMVHIKQQCSFLRRIKKSLAMIISIFITVAKL